MEDIKSKTKQIELTVILLNEKYEAEKEAILFRNLFLGSLTIIVILTFVINNLLSKII